jgi:hypothetical protein
VAIRASILTLVNGTYWKAFIYEMRKHMHCKSEELHGAPYQQEEHTNKSRTAKGTVPKKE